MWANPDLLFVQVYDPLDGQISIRLLFSTNQLKSSRVLGGGMIPPIFFDCHNKALKSPPIAT